MWEALREAVDEEMEKDPNVCVIGMAVSFLIILHTGCDKSAYMGLDCLLHCERLLCCVGEDVGHYGGSYKVTYDLHKKYGDFRLLDTPICGMNVTGTAACTTHSTVALPLNIAEV